MTTDLTFVHEYPRMEVQMASNVFRISLFKNWLALGGIPWVNTYEVSTDAPVEADAEFLATLAEALANFEQELHVPQVFIDRAVISSWQADSTPYNPINLRVVTMAMNGARNVGADERVDLNIVLKVRRGTQNGRAGKLALRGVLTETDVNASASGFMELIPSSPVAVGGGVWTSAMSQLDGWFDGSQQGRLSMVAPVSASDPEPLVRYLSGFTPSGAGIVRMKHKWYNRAATP